MWTKIDYKDNFVEVVCRRLIYRYLLWTGKGDDIPGFGRKDKMSSLSGLIMNQGFLTSSVHS